MSPVVPPYQPILLNLFGEAIQENAPLARYTAAQVGGSADALLVVNSAADLANAVQQCWQNQIPFKIIGSGANVLVSDRGVRGLVILNHAHNVKVDASTPSVWAESGANLGAIARQVALRGLSGLEWAGSIPGTVGGAVYGNAGAHDGDANNSLLLAEILHPVHGKLNLTRQDLGYTYRSSALKRGELPGVILSVRLKLENSTPEAVKEKMAQFTDHRKRTQPPGASLGSMFKNPPGDYAGRLIEASGLKGKRVGGVAVSQVHANFFVNDEKATAADYHSLVNLVRHTVAEKQGISLELEIEFIGEWN